MEGITVYAPRRQGAMPEFLVHTDEATRRSVARFKSLLEDHGEGLDAGLLYKAMTTHDMARVLAFLVETKFYEPNHVIDIQNYELA